MPNPPQSAIQVAEKVGRLLDERRPERERLHRVVAALKRAMRVDVCSLYRVSSRSGDLYLEATDGLSQTLVGQRALKAGEGLTGLVVRTRRAVPVRDGPSHPDFRYVPGTGEEMFHSFLGAPLQSHGRVVGALVVQTKDERDFLRDEIALLLNIARQIGAAASGAFAEIERRTEGAASAGPVAPADGRRIAGRSLSPGCFAGQPVSLDHGMRLETASTAPSKGYEIEIRELRKANRKVRADLAREASNISGDDARDVLMAHKVLLEDESIAREVMGRVEKGESAAEAVRQTGIRWIARLENLPDPAFAARATDFRDIANRLMYALGVEAAEHPRASKGRVVAVARMMLPGDLLRLGRERIGALVLADQGVYSHTAIVARSFDIPAVQVDPAALDEVLRARTVLVDGDGAVHLDPSRAVVNAATARAARESALPAGGPRDLARPVQTTDGHELRIGMNAGLLDELETIDRHGPEDVGLYRTEIAFMSHAALPGLRAQMAHYRKVLRLAGGRRVVFRTFDFGGDKVSPSISVEHEDNPMMGYRSTRYLLDHTEILRTQVRALLAVSHEGPMSILVPMISTPEEFNLVLDQINAVRNEMESARIAFDPDVPVGAMIEVPSALFQIAELSRLADFFCVGSNDLIQYLMAADRSNPRVSRLYQWRHPAVLVALDRVVRHCRRNKRPVTFCGEMAAEPWAAMLLAGMGYEHLSVDHHSVPLVKWTLAQCSMRRLRSMARTAMRATSSTGVTESLYAQLAEIARVNPTLGGSLRESLDRLGARAD